MKTDAINRVPTADAINPDPTRRIQAPCDALVLDARLRQSLVTVRSLGSRGLHTAALESYATVPTFSSRWCMQAFIYPVQEGSDAYLAHLEQVLESSGSPVLISSSDGTIAMIRQHRERLEKRARIALAKEPALGRHVCQQGRRER